MTEVYDEATKGKRITFSETWKEGGEGEPSGYDHWELYNEEKEYYEGNFTADYGHGPQRYEWRAHNDKFMVAHLYATPEEIKELAPFCRCSVCTRRDELCKSRCCGYYFPTVLVDIYATYTSGCPGCHGCIKNGHHGAPEDYIIREARAYQKKKL